MSPESCYDVCGGSRGTFGPAFWRKLDCDRQRHGLCGRYERYVATCISAKLPIINDAQVMCTTPAARGVGKLGTHRTILRGTYVASAGWSSPVLPCMPQMPRQLPICRKYDGCVRLRPCRAAPNCRPRATLTMPCQSGKCGKEVGGNE
jgi:hypothetical protein